MAVIDRRELLQLGAAALTAGSLSKVGFAQNAPAPAAAAAAPVKKIKIDAYSRTLHWLKTPGEVAEACRQIGNTTIDLTVRTSGHVQPDKVKTDLPIWVRGLERGGVTVTSMAADITDANTAFVEDMMGTASSLGIRYHWWRGIGGFDNTKPYGPQIEAFKPRLAALVKLDEKYNMKAMYHPQGGPFFDYLELVRQFDPKYVGLHFDTGHWVQIAQGNMASMINWAGPYVAGFVFKDIAVEQVDAATAAAEAAARQGGAARGGANAGAGQAPAAAPAAGAAAGGRGGRAGGGRGQAAAGGGAANAAAAPGGAPAGGGRGGGGGSVNGYRTRQVPVGTGIVNFVTAANALKVIGFDGPTECQPEWPGLGGAEGGRDTLTLPREEVIRLLKRDYDTIHAALVTAGVA